MNKRTILITGILLILVISVVMAVGNFNIVGRSVDIRAYAYTKAVCNSQNECIDVLIKCSNGNVESIEPVSELVKFDESWEDFRENKEFC